MKEMLHSVMKKVTLELIYEVVDERTQDLRTRLARVEEKLDHRFDALNARIDQLFVLTTQKNGK